MLLTKAMYQTRILVTELTKEKFWNYNVIQEKVCG